MNIIQENFIWMPFNIVLACVAVLFSLVMIKVKSLKLKLLFGILWLLYIPNTIYILTDLVHLLYQIFLVKPHEYFLLFAQYGLLTIVGVFTFVVSLYPFEIILKENLKLKKQPIQWIIFFINFIISFGVILGRFQRVHSWDIFLNAFSVVENSFAILESPSLSVLVIIYGLIGNILYMLLKPRLIRYFTK